MNEGITVIGLGPGAAGYLTVDTLTLLRESSRTFLRTKIHPVVEWLLEQGMVFSTFDYLYEQRASFQEVYVGICREVLAAAQKGPVLYAVPGHPLVYEESVHLILEAAEREKIGVLIQPAMSFIDAMLAALKINVQDGLQVLDGLSIDEQALVTGGPVIVTQVHSSLVASDVKITLLEHYPAEHLIMVVRAAGVPGLERIERIPLWKLDRLDWTDHLTSLYLPEYRTDSLDAAAKNKGKPADIGKPMERRIIVSRPTCRFPLDRLAGLMARLRGPKGCPWDREQNHLTLRAYLLEETYEVLEALHEEDMYKLCEELGDLLLQIVFHAQIASEKDVFDLNDVVEGICEKIIRRHPHVFGTVTVKDSNEVNLNWEKIKAEEKGGEGPKYLLDSVSMNMPALTRAVKLQKKAAGTGFDWPDYQGTLDKFHEEIAELRQALADDDKRQIEGETGDLLFSVVNVARWIGVDPEIALIAACDKFVNRFNHIEDKAREHNKKLNTCTLEQLDVWWNDAKKIEIK